MSIVTCPCSCRPDETYADGTSPLFFTDGAKAAYWWKKLIRKRDQGMARANSELVVEMSYMPSLNDWEPLSRREPLPELSDYGFYVGVHLDGEHILSVK
jgi:hypothetical protein